MQAHFKLVLSLLTDSLADATHIFDGLSDFPTHVAHMRSGSFVQQPSPWPITSPTTLATRNPSAASLYVIALQWLKEDRENRRELEKEGKKMRGARKNEVRFYHLHPICRSLSIA